MIWKTSMAFKIICTKKNEKYFMLYFDHVFIFIFSFIILLIFVLIYHEMFMNKHLMHSIIYIMGWCSLFTISVLVPLSSSLCTLRNVCQDQFKKSSWKISLCSRIITTAWWYECFVDLNYQRASAYILSNSGVSFLGFFFGFFLSILRQSLRSSISWDQKRTQHPQRYQTFGQEPIIRRLKVHPRKNNQTTKITDLLLC